MLKTEATREITKTELAKAEERWAKLDLQKKRISNIFYELKQAEKVDICFLVDCTGSMDSYITETKLVIHKIVDKLKTLYADFKLRVAFVGYRDHSDGNDRVTVFPFNSDIDAFKSFVSSVKATGGDDQCEDVFGGGILILQYLFRATKNKNFLFQFSQINVSNSPFFITMSPFYRKFK